ncbi:MAG: AI-2E family transporter [Acidobacteriota bacterium]|jgi:predicted PurR-regulated permease PerM
MPISFSDRQEQTIAAALTTVATLVIVLAIGLLGWLLAAFIGYFSGVFLPLAVGAIAALVCRPYYETLRTRLKLPKAAAVAVVFVSVLLPATAFLWLFGSLLVSQLVELVSHLPEYVAQVRTWIEERLPAVTETLRASGLDERLRETLAGQHEMLAGWLQQFGSQAFAAGVNVFRGVSALLGWIILPVYFAYFLSAEGLRFDSDNFLPFLKPETRKDVTYLLHEFVTIIVAFFRGQLIIAFLQGVLYALGFSVIGLSYGFVIGMLMGMLNVIPYLGMLIGLGMALPMALLQPGGGIGLMLLSLLVIVIVQQIEGWFLTPKIMGDRTGLHYMTIIVAIFFWGTALGGIMGMILAIPLTAFLASLWRLVREKYIPEII